jgi:hypothetical protein
MRIVEGLAASRYDLIRSRCVHLFDQRSVAIPDIDERRRSWGVVVRAVTPERNERLFAHLGSGAGAPIGNLSLLRDRPFGPSNIAAAPPQESSHP